MKHLFTDYFVSPKRYRYIVSYFELVGHLDKNGILAWRWHITLRIYVKTKKEALKYVSMYTQETYFKATLKKLTKGGK